MTSTYVRIFVTLLIFFAGCLSVSAYDRLVLSLIWGPTYCKWTTPRCVINAVETDFKVHGLWPQNDQGPQPSFCRPLNSDDAWLFQGRRIPDHLLNEMEQCWPSYRGLNRLFWSHEWHKHGKCSGYHKIPYLLKTIRTFSSLDLFHALEQAGITPIYDDEPPRHHLRESLIQALARHRPAIGRVEPQLICSWDGALMYIRFSLLPRVPGFTDALNWGNCTYVFRFVKYRNHAPPPPPRRPPSSLPRRPPPPPPPPPVKNPKGDNTRVWIPTNAWSRPGGSLSLFHTVKLVILLFSFIPLAINVAVVVTGSIIKHVKKIHKL